MIRYVGCDYARARLDSFMDGELPMGDQVLVETHLRWCHTCAARIEDAQIIGASLRMMARAHEDAGRRGTDAAPQDSMGRALATMQSEVLARVDTEYEQSLGVRIHELFSDMRLWWPALGATVAVALSVGLASGVWQATSAEQPASLAAMIENLADPGSNRNPQRLDAAMYLPRLDDGVALDGLLMQDSGDGHQDEVVAVAATVTREGKISDYALLEQVGARHMLTPSGIAADNEMQGVLHAVRQSRFAPAQRPGRQVVAVNMVWLFARTTVKASHRTVDLGMPLTRPALAVPPAAAKPVSLPLPPEATSSRDLPPAPSPAPLESATA